MLQINLKQQGPNQYTVQIGNLYLFFSYETIIGFEHPSTGIVCSDEFWSTTTSKFQNKLSNKEERVPHKDFSKKLTKLLKKFEQTERGMVNYY